MTHAQRTTARNIFDAGVAAANPFDCVVPHLKDWRGAPAQIVAFGKAAVGMARGAKQKFPNTPILVVTNYENATDMSGATVLASGHPVPDVNGVVAAQAVIRAVSGTTGPILALISGGGSALLPAPAGDINLEDKASLNSLLLAAGLDIMQMNKVRQQVSDLKGGGILRFAAPHPVTSLILSDVIGDDTSVIASGPTARPLGTKADARTILENAGLWDAAPESVRRHLGAASQSTPLPDHRNILVGSNRQSVLRMEKYASNIHAIEAPIVGDVSSAAQLICDACETGITVWGGETTVALKGGVGAIRNWPCASHSKPKRAVGKTGPAFRQEATGGMARQTRQVASSIKERSLGFCKLALTRKPYSRTTTVTRPCRFPGIFWSPVRLAQTLQIWVL